MYVCVHVCTYFTYEFLIFLSGSAGVYGFHFYTLNLERSVFAVLKDLGVESSMAMRR